MKCLFFLPLTLLFLLSSTVSSQNPNMFDFDFACDKSHICDEKDIFNQAGQIISDNLVLTSRIKVRVAVFESDQPSAYGFADPGTATHVDQDGVTRIYPTALLKQLDSNFKPDGPAYDIYLGFNYDRDDSLWFPGKDSAPIKPRQFDFLELTLRLLHRGLGIYTTWSQNKDDVTGNGLLPNINYHVDNNNFVFDSFSENIFDKYLVSMKDGVRLSTFVGPLNDIAGQTGKKFDKIIDFLSTLTSKQKDSGKSTSRYVTQLATIPNGLGFLPNDDSSNGDISEAILLETSYSPLVDRINIEHFSHAGYADTSDFLLIPYQVPGISLQEKINANGNVPGGGVGPSVMTILETLGYKSRLPSNSKNNLNLQSVTLQKNNTN